MEKRKSFVVYVDLDESLASFSDQEVGSIFRAMLTYAATGRESDLTDREAVAFGFIRAQMDRDFEKYDGIVEKRKAAVAAREEKKKSGDIKSNQMISNDNKCYQMISRVTDNDTVTDTDTDTDTENENVTGTVTDIIIPPLPPTGGTARGNAFEMFWKAYPKKVGKAACEKEWTRRCYTSEEADEMVKALERQKRTDQWKRGYIPNPLKWLKEERWNDTEAQPTASVYEEYQRQNAAKRLAQLNKGAT